MGKNVHIQVVQCALLGPEMKEVGATEFALLVFGQNEEMVEYLSEREVKKMTPEKIWSKLQRRPQIQQEIEKKKGFYLNGETFVNVTDVRA